MSIAGFRPLLPSNWADVYVKCLALSTFRPSAKAPPRGRFSVPEVATCTNSCKKKFLESGLIMDIRCPLPLGSGVD